MEIDSFDFKFLKDANVQHPEDMSPSCDPGIMIMTVEFHTDCPVVEVKFIAFNRRQRQAKLTSDIVKK